MYSGYIGLSGTIRNLRLIADIASPEIKQAGPFLTLPFLFYSHLAILCMDDKWMLTTDTKQVN